LNAYTPDNGFWFSLRYRFLARLAGLMARVPVARTRRLTIPEGVFYIKERPWYLEPVVRAGNVHLKSLEARVRICESAEWMIWEPRAYEIFFGYRARPCGKSGLLLPELPGRPLACILGSQDHSAQAKLRALDLAIGALRALHQRQIAWPDGRERSFSHGDATVKNVLVDLDAGTACWIDFETLHDPEAPSPWRQADDLRALLYSAAGHLQRTAFYEACRRIIHVEGESPVLRALSAMILAGQKRINTYHLAQDRLALAERRHLDSVLLRELG
jgi:hypothetical protein